MASISVYDYERVSFLENSNHDSFKIKNGQWSGTVVTYGEVAVTEPLDKEVQPTLKFQYVINETPMDKSELESDPKFNNYLGDMLSHIIDTALEENNFAIGEKPDGTEFTDDNTKEFN